MTLPSSGAVVVEGRASASLELGRKIMPLTWNLAFHSGMSAVSDLRAAVEEGVAVGVVATLLDLVKTIRTLPRHLDTGGAVFIDSGAFAAFQKSEQVNWSRVFSAYETVLGHTDQPGGLSIVAPDVIGDQMATLALWEEHAARVRSWVTSGARVIVPLQRGELSAGSMLAHAKRIFQTDRFCAGIPSNLEAMSSEDCSTLHHHDFHVLGRVILTAELSIKLRALLKNNPGAIYTADANWMRSRIRQISSAAQRLRHGCSPRNGFETARTRAVRAVLRSEAYTLNTDAVCSIQPSSADAVQLDLW